MCHRGHLDISATRQTGPGTHCVGTCAAKMAFMTAMYCSVASGDPCRHSMRGRALRLPPARALTRALLMRHRPLDRPPDSTAGFAATPAGTCSQGLGTSLLMPHKQHSKMSSACFLTFVGLEHQGTLCRNECGLQASRNCMQQRASLECKAYAGAWMQQHLDAPSVHAGGLPNWPESPEKDCWSFLLLAAVWWRPGELKRHGGGHCMHMTSFLKPELLDLRYIWAQHAGDVPDADLVTCAAHNNSRALACWYLLPQSQLPDWHHLG